MKVVRLGMVAGLSVLTVAALALPAMVAGFKAAYPKIPAESALMKAGCATCHVPKSTKLNPYGADLKKALEAAKTKKLTADVLKKIESLDSDKDGVKNGEEIKKGTLPGDPKSK
jgi:mono/diheme cytochrome c family protein